jgi:peptidoglycan/LPS O-acetylase OafA/YrhL
MDMLRGISIIAVVIHHWLLFMHNSGSTSFSDVLAEFIHDVAGTFVHIFFILSGWGLTVSYFGKGFSSWKAWGRRRLEKIVLPYWIIILLTFSFVNLVHYILPTFIASKYSWVTLLTYLTFTRNFYSPGWGLNPTLWFMPVIVGLYLVFPILVMILKKYGTTALLLFSAIITYGSITVSINIGYPLDHQRAVFLFFVIEFSLGMVLGYKLNFDRQYLRHLSGLKPFCLGLLLFIISWTIRKFWPLGSFYKGALTATGIFLITLQLCGWINRLSPSRISKILSHFSDASYFMYVTHGPIIIFLVKPLIQEVIKIEVDALTLIIFGFVCCIGVFELAKIISLPLNRVSLRLVHHSRIVNPHIEA